MHFPSAYRPIGRLRGKVVRYWENRRRLEESVASGTSLLSLPYCEQLSAICRLVTEKCC
jgi:hypothetical protein